MGKADRVRPGSCNDLKGESRQCMSPLVPTALRATPALCQGFLCGGLILRFLSCPMVNWLIPAPSRPDVRDYGPTIGWLPGKKFPLLHPSLCRLHIQVNVRTCRSGCMIFKKILSGILTRIPLNVQINLGGNGIFTLSRLPIQEPGLCLHF